MSDEACIPGLQNFFHDRWVIDLLGVVEFSAARVARCVIVPDILFVLPNASNDIAVHDLDVVDVEEEFHVG